MAFSLRKFLLGIRLVPSSSSNAAAKGDLEVLDSSSKIQYHNGTTISSIVTETHASQGANRLQNKDLSDDNVVIVDASDTTKQIKFDASGTTGTSTTLLSSQTTNKTLTLPDATDTLVGKATSDILTNKTIDGDDNTVQDLALTSLKTNLTDASKFIVRDASGVPVSNTKTVPAGDVVGTSDSQVLTGKTIDGDDNTVQDLALSSLKTNLTDASKFLVRDASGIVISNTKAVPTGTVVGTSDAQALTAKDIDGGTASNTSRITTPKNTLSNLTALTRKEGTILYATDTQQFLIDNGSSLLPIGGSFTTYSNENISASGTVTISTTIGMQYRRITGNGAAVTASSTPFGTSPPSDGCVIRLIGQSDTNTVTFTNNDATHGMILNGNATLGQYNILEVQYDSTAGRYIEVSRNF